MPHAAVVALFNEARARDYDEIADPLTRLIKDRKARKESRETFTSRLEKVRRRFQEIREIDYFQSSRGDDLKDCYARLKHSNPRRKNRRRDHGSAARITGQKHAEIITLLAKGSDSNVAFYTLDHALGPFRKFFL